MKKRDIAFLVSLLMAGLVGCGSSGGNDSFLRIIHGEPNSVVSIQHLDYFNNKFKDISNLASIGKKYSDYNGQNTLVVKDIPVDKNREALYICMLSNPNVGTISCNISMPTCFVANKRTNFSTNSLLTSSNDFQRKNSYERSLSSRFNIDGVPVKIVEHANEEKKQIVPFYYSYLGKDNQDHVIIRNNCELVFISKHAKFFVDKADYDGSKENNPFNRKLWKYLDISEEEIKEFAKEFEEKSFPLLKKYFGNGNDIFWWDIDNDKKISIVFTPTCANLGGYINELHFGLNSRDMIFVCTQLERESPEKEEYYKALWSQFVSPTITHECQHLINASSKIENHYPHVIIEPEKLLDILIYDKKYQQMDKEESGFNEGLSVFSELIYHKQRGIEVYPDVGKDQDVLLPDYLGNLQSLPYFMNNRNIPLIQNFSQTLEEYAQKGMFTYYLYEQFGEKAINDLCRGDFGVKKYNALDSNRNLAQLFIDFNFAFELETLRNYFPKDNNPYDNITDNTIKF